jgi:CBS domain-containing protein
MRASGVDPRRPNAQEVAMKVSEAMTRDVRVANPDQSIREAAQMMAELDAGVLPVGADDRLVGMITDRDIAIRGVAKGRTPDTPVRDVMTDDVKYCFEDEDIDHVARNMADIQVRRLPVVNRDKRLVGIIAIADLAASEDPEVVGDTVSGISEPPGDR